MEVTLSQKSIDALADALVARIQPGRVTETAVDHAKYLATAFTPADVVRMQKEKLKSQRGKRHDCAAV